MFFVQTRLHGAELWLKRCLEDNEFLFSFTLVAKQLRGLRCQTAFDTQALHLLKYYNLVLKGKELPFHDQEDHQNYLQDHQSHLRDHQNPPQVHQLGLVVVLVMLMVVGVVLVVL